MRIFPLTCVRTIRWCSSTTASARFSGGNPVGVALLSSVDVFMPENLKLLQELTEAFKHVNGIAYVTNLTNVVDFRKTD